MSKMCINMQDENGKTCKKWWWNYSCAWFYRKVNALAAIVGGNIHT